MANIRFFCNPACKRFHGHLSLAILLLAGALLAACADVRPVAQVGLLVPFEGNYRRTGYGALEAVRSTLTDLPAAHTGLIPLALDTSLDAPRAAQKLAILPAVGAVLGPLTAQEIGAVAAVLRTRDLLWIAPFAASDTGFVAPDDPAWLDGMIVQFAAEARAAGVTRLVIAGWDASGWWEPGAGLGAGAPIVLLPDLAAMQPGDGLIWLGDASAGAQAVRDLHDRLPAVPVWLAPWAADQLFAEHYAAGPDAAWGPIRFGAWLPASLEAQDSAALLAALLPAATQIAGAQIAGIQKHPATDRPWAFYLFSLNP